MRTALSEQRRAGPERADLQAGEALHARRGLERDRAGRRIEARGDRLVTLDAQFNSLKQKNDISDLLQQQPADPGLWQLQGMLLATTNHVTQNVASIPLLWLAPLTLYLLTFIIAFEERIALFQQKKNPKQQAKPAAPKPETPKEEPKAPSVTVHVPEHTPATHEMIEEKVRHEVEAEYRAKFTQELRKAEELATKMVIEERAKLEEQRRAVKAQREQLTQQAAEIDGRVKQAEAVVARTEQMLLRLALAVSKSTAIKFMSRSFFYFPSLLRNFPR
mgnify:CR=1 FL=1